MDTDLPGIELGSCPECHLGTLRPGTAFFCTQVGGTLISAPDFPAWICDVCGRREYDEISVQELEALLQVERGQRAQHRQTAPTGQAAAPVARGPSNSKRS